MTKTVDHDDPGARPSSVRRAGSVIGLHPSAIEEYERHHRAVWPEVTQALTAAHIRNYSIYRYGTLLFSYWEYTGDDYEADLARLDADPACARWGEIMRTLQSSVDAERPGQWMELPEVFHLD